MPPAARALRQPAGSAAAAPPLSSILRPPLRELQLATLVDAPPEGPEWLHEQKFDGYRILAARDGDRVTLCSRRFRDWTAAFPAVEAAVAALPVRRALLDGEVAILLPDGRTSFQGLQGAIGGAARGLVYFVFDLLALDDEDLRALPLEARKERLAALVAQPPGARPGVIRYSDHVVGEGARFFALACARGLEGIVSKRRDLPYQPGRGPAWQKAKCVRRQELVIGGFTEPEGSRAGLGALLVGYREGDRLVYAGKVGTGFSRRTLVELRAQLDALVQPASPFQPEPPRAWTGARRHWVKPALVAEIRFAEWTADGRLRHPAFEGLRLDKSPADVVREQPAEPAPSAAPAAPAAADAPARSRGRATRAVTGRGGPRRASRARAARAPRRAAPARRARPHRRAPRAAAASTRAPSRRTPR